MVMTMINVVLRFSVLPFIDPGVGGDNRSGKLCCGFVGSIRITHFLAFSRNNTTTWCPLLICCGTIVYAVIVVFPASGRQYQGFREQNRIVLEEFVSGDKTRLFQVREARVGQVESSFVKIVSGEEEILGSRTEQLRFVAVNLNSVARFQKVEVGTVCLERALEQCSARSIDGCHCVVLERIQSLIFVLVKTKSGTGWKN